MTTEEKTSKEMVKELVDSIVICELCRTVVNGGKKVHRPFQKPYAAHLACLKKKSIWWLLPMSAYQVLYVLGDLLWSIIMVIGYLILLGLLWIGRKIVKFIKLFL